MGPERAREAGGGHEAVVERDGEHALVGVVDQRHRRALEAQPLDEGGQRLAGDGPEDAMEVEGREVPDAGQALERQVLGQMVADVVDDLVYSLLVLGTSGPRGHPLPALSG